MDLTLGSLLIFLLIAFRILGCLMALPFFAPGIAVPMKGALSVLLAFLLFPAAGLGVPAPALDLYYIVLVAQEVLLGLIMGFVVRLVFSIISVAGEMASQEMGFRMSRQVDPLTGTQAPAITQFYQILAYLLFFAVNGHYWILVILARSFKVSPLCALDLRAGFGEWFAGLFTRVFSLGIQLSAPIFLLMLMISIGVGMLSKLVEGINVFDIGFPIRIGVGLLFIMLFIPFLGQTMHKVFAAVQEGLMGLLTAI
jgi:flagellar biosynthetic protein FliR